MPYIYDYTIFCEDSIQKLKEMEPNSIDCILTDPPYNLESIVKRFKNGPPVIDRDGQYERLARGFMGQEWDTDIAFKKEIWELCHKVLKPGGHLVAFSHEKTYHRLATAIEHFFDIRGMFTWTYKTGFPKGRNIAKDIDKIIMGDNFDPEEIQSEKAKRYIGTNVALKPCFEPAAIARKPLEKASIARQVIDTGTGGINIGQFMRWPNNSFYCPKPSRTERDLGCQNIKPTKGHDAVKRKEGSKGINSPRAGAGRTAQEVLNNHPTVKPVTLFSHLAQIFCPVGGTILDPFCGSGTTGVASLKNERSFIGIEKDEHYQLIAKARCEYQINQNIQTTIPW
jgi:site-specific DNA-methyltransferase (adenine-specific)